MSTLTSMPVAAHQASPYKRKRTASHSRSRSRSPRRAPSPPTNRRRSASPAPKVHIAVPKIDDVDPVRRQERERQLALRIAAQELDGAAAPKPAPDTQAELARIAASKSGGVYMPPARLRALQAAAAQDKAAPAYQRLSWDALRKSITGIVNRVNVGNIKHVVPELFAENLIRGRGLFARSVMKAQAASLPYTPIFAALVAIINTKLPQVGELVLHRLISQFRKSFKRNDKILCQSTSTFIAHLVNQGLAHEIIALQILVLLLERPTDDSVEIAVGFMREVGAFLAENSPKANANVFERFRVVLNEGTISQRVQFMVEVLMQVRKDKYKDNPILLEGLDLVPEEDQITHQVGLDDDLQVLEGLNIFKADPDFMKNEEKYREIKAEILGENESSDGSGSDGSEDEDDEDEAPVESKEGIEDQTGTNLVNLRRTIYLTIMNSLNFEEAVHKLMKVNIEEGEEIEMCNMIIECCSQERSYSNFYGLIGERFSKLSRPYTGAFEQAFRNYYDTVHRYETNRLRNIARFFGHLLATDSVSWAVLDVVRMNEEDTTSSSRIFVKILCGEMMEEMGLKGLTERFKDPEIRDCCKGLFPMDNPKNTRFAINYFTSIGLGAITEEMREHLKNAPRIIMEQRRALLEEESSSSSDSSDSDSSSESDSSKSDSDSASSRSTVSRRRRRSSTPPRRRERDDSRGKSRNEAVRGPPRSLSRSPPRYARRERSVTPDRRDLDRPPPVRRDAPPHVPVARGRHGSESPPPPRARHEDDERYPPRRGEPSGRGRDREPYARRRDDSRERYRDPSPPRRGGRDETPPRRGGRDETPPRRGGRDESPPRRAGREESPPRRAGRDEGRYRRERSYSRERYDRRR